MYTGEDCTSAFKGKGKVGPLKKLQKTPEHQTAFQKLGEKWKVANNMYESLEAFTCLLYGQQRYSCLNNARFQMLKKMVGEGESLSAKSKVELSRLPPCKDACRQHVKRVNYRVCLYKRASERMIEKPMPYDDQGWMKVGEYVEPQWSLRPSLPPSLVDLLDTEHHDNIGDNDEEFTTDDDELLDLDF